MFHRSPSSASIPTAPRTSPGMTARLPGGADVAAAPAAGRCPRGHERTALDRQDRGPRTANRPAGLRVGTADGRGDRDL